MRARLLAASAALMLTAACGGEPSPAPAPYGGPSNPRSTPAESERTSASAVQFISEYMREFTAATKSGDVAQMVRLGTKGCPSCKTLVGNIESFYKNGGRASGANYVPEGFSLRSSIDASEVVLEGVVQFAKQTQTPSPGASPRVAKGGPAKSRITLKWTDSGWRMANWEYL